MTDDAIPDAAEPYWVKALQHIINPLLASDSFTQQALTQLQGKVIKLVIEDWQVSLYILIDTETMLFKHGYDDDKVDVVLQARLSTLLHLSQQSDLSQLQAGQVQIKGDAAVVQQFFQIVSNLEIDWEEWLAQRLGDVPAQHIGDSLRQGGQHLRATLQRWHQNIKEYMQEEAQYLPPRAAVEVWSKQVTNLDYALTDLQQRIENLEHKKH